MDSPGSTSQTVHRRLIRVSGVVQGVGFRPFVYRLAERFTLVGTVRNTSGTVEIDVEGPSDALDAFLHALQTEAPTLARVDSVVALEADPVGLRTFEIVQSLSQVEPSPCIPADMATCEDCFREIADPSDRRYRYPFTNCTNCGPRFTIIRRVPYDRDNTTMAAFEMCPDCLREYENPANRRFHAEPIACPACGPHVWLESCRDGSGCGASDLVASQEAIKHAGQMLRQGRIVAVKGLGGFHLACDAANDEAVFTLRERKGRVAKPFALMVRDLAIAAQLCELDDHCISLLTSRERPIVLIKRRQDAPVSPHVAPANNYLGLMLPYTPLHALLMQHSPPMLVMTSGNLSEEPLAFTNLTARTKLAKLADVLLLHDRDIHVPCDDSVVKPLRDGSTMLIRRARGFLPDAISLPVECDCILGVGGEQKNTFCLAWKHSAVLSQHIGDLDTVETFDYYQYAVRHFLALFQKEPKLIAHDLHPDYLSTRYAREWPRVALIGVQHHHAHIASCLAEHGREEKCIGLAMDGTGYGDDGTIWGGEILVADFRSYKRVGHFRPVIMPGGEAAIYDPRRMAAAYIKAAFGEEAERVFDSLDMGFTSLEFAAINHQIETGLNSPLTSSAGRLFDSVSAAIGICRQRTYEGQPAVELEMAADEKESARTNDGLDLQSYLGLTEPYACGDSEFTPISIDGVAIFRSAVNDRIAGVDPSVISARFHLAFAALLANASRIVRDRTGLNLVALSGGVFQNEIVVTQLSKMLDVLGFEVLQHKLLPPNDACISYGQVAIAAARSLSDRS